MALFQSLNTAGSTVVMVTHEYDVALTPAVLCISATGL